MTDAWMTPKDDQAHQNSANEIGAIDVAPGPWHVVWINPKNEPAFTFCGRRAHGGRWRDLAKVEYDSWPVCRVCADLHEREKRIDWGRVSAEIEQARAAATSRTKEAER